MKGNKTITIEIGSGQLCEANKKLDTKSNKKWKEALVGNIERNIREYRKGCSCGDDCERCLDALIVTIKSNLRAL